MKWVVTGAAALLIGIGSANAQPPPPPTYEPIPPPRQEFVPPPPGPRVIWEPGHWHWDGFRYVWVNGHYIQRRQRASRYVDGRWDWAPRQGRWVWRPAHWE